MASPKRNRPIETDFRKRATPACSAAHQDARSLDSVVVFTTTNAYPLGSVRSGDSVVVLARSGGESHFEVEFGPSGGRTRVVVGGYFENGYVGSFRVRMTRDTVRATESQISASGY